MKIMVCGSIGYGGIDDIRQLYSFLRKEGFDTVDQIMSKGTDYSQISDFRNKKALSHQIVTNDLEFINKTDVLVVLADKPSYGTGIEMFIAKNSGKPVILFSKSPLPTPWPINFSDYIVKSEEELIKSLHDLEQRSGK
jgi:nucleoside 2-deoxyribosyltransferase